MDTTGTTSASTTFGRTPPDWETFSLAMLDASRHGVAAVGGTGIVEFANHAAEATLGLRAGVAIEGLLPELWPTIVKALKERAHQQGVSVQGEAGSYLAKVSPILLNSRLMGTLCIFEDTTELEAITRKMLSFQQLSRELDAIIDSSSDGLWITDGQGVVIRVNPASERINSIRAEDVVGRGTADLLAEGLIDRSASLEVINTKSPVNLLQQTREGRKLMVTGNPVFDERGSLTRVVVNERDITEIDRLHRELEQQEAISEEIRQQMLLMQLEEVEARNIISRSPAMTNILRQALRVSAVDSNVLILGESGTGKGLIADLIHKHSRRAANPLIKINCGAIPESLMESELFGYERGAFTGAHKSGKPGHFELADKGMVFLDEIAEMPLTSQVKLLRFLEDGCATRIGATVSRKLDVRVLAATNRDLEASVMEGLFRRDLYYRLSVIPIHIPPLRERREDILPLIQHFVAHFGEKLGARKHLTHAALDALLAYSYPGNVRELMNLCERLVVMSEPARIDLADLPAPLGEGSRSSAPLHDHLGRGGTFQELMEDFERAVLKEAITTYGNQQSMASALGVNQSTVARKLKKYGLSTTGTMAS